MPSIMSGTIECPTTVLYMLVKAATTSPILAWSADTSPVNLSTSQVLIPSYRAFVAAMILSQFITTAVMTATAATPMPTGPVKRATIPVSAVANPVPIAVPDKSVISDDSETRTG